MSLRRYRIKQDEYAKVLDWLRRRGKEAKATDEDEKSAQPLEEAGFRMPADWLPKITWAHKVNMRIKKGAHGKDQVQVLEKEVWKTLVHEMQIDAYLRDKLLSTSADVPMSRDAGYHITQKRTVGISRRAFMKFLRKQEVLQLTRDALPEKKGVGRPPEARGNLEIDLVAPGEELLLDHADRQAHRLARGEADLAEGLQDGRAGDPEDDSQDGESPAHQDQVHSERQRVRV